MKLCATISRALVVISVLYLLTLAITAAPIRVVVPSDAKLWQRSLSVAKSQVGVREATGRNDGKAVEAYLRSVGLGKGYPYCQAGQYWSFATAAREIGLPSSAVPIKRTASTQAAWTDAVRRGKKTVLKPQAGDLITWWAQGTTKGHVERVIEVKSGGWVRTVGFNTSSGTRGNQRDGGGVYLRYRNWITPDMRMLVRGFTGHEPKGQL